MKLDNMARSDQHIRQGLPFDLHVPQPQEHDLQVHGPAPPTGLIWPTPIRHLPPAIDAAPVVVAVDAVDDADDVAVAVVAVAAAAVVVVAAAVVVVVVAVDAAVVVVAAAVVVVVVDAA